MKHIVRRFLALALVLCMTMAVAVTASADETASATLDLSAQKDGSKMVVTIELKDCANLTGISVYLEYDNTKLIFDSFEGGGLLGSPESGACVSNQTKVKMLFGGMSSKNKNGLSGTLATVVFDIKSDAKGEAAFSLSKGASTNADGKSGTVSYVHSSVTVSFSEPSYSISAAKAVNGTITVDKTDAVAGETVTVTALPDSGYGVETITANGTEAESIGNNQYTFTMPAEDVTVSATFVEKPYHVTVDGSIANGTITVAPAAAEKGETITITVTPDDEYLVSKVTASGANITPVAGTNHQYTFIMPGKDVTVSAVFTLRIYEITVSSGENGTAAADKKTAAKGETVTVTVHPEEGYTVDQITAGSAKVTRVSGTEYTFSMPGGDTEVSVTFREGSDMDPTETEPTEEPTTEPTQEPTQEPTAEPTQEPTAEPTQPAPEPTNPQTTGQDPQSGIPGFVWILILLMVLCIGAIGFIIYRSKKNQ